MNELCQNVLIVCASRFIYGLHDFIRVSKVLNTNFYIFGYFLARLGGKAGDSRVVAVVKIGFMN